jgi:hypothetical protein
LKPYRGSEAMIDGLVALFHLHEFQSQALAAVLTAAVGVLVRYLQPAARVVWGTSHGFMFLIPQQNGPPAGLNTRSFFMKNIGRATAKGLEVHFNYKPEHLQVWPTYSYTSTTNPEGRYCLQIDNLGKKEWLSIEVIALKTALPDVLRVRTHQGECKAVLLAPMQIFPRWVQLLVVALMLAGVFWAFETLIGFFR